MINLTQQRAQEQQNLKESGEVFQVKNILKTYDHSKQSFVQQSCLRIDNNIGTKIRQIRQTNTKHSSNNKEQSYSQNAVRQVYDQEKIIISQQNNFNFDNSKTYSQNKKQTKLSIKILIHQQGQLSGSLMSDELVEQNRNQFTNIQSQLTQKNKQKTQPTKQDSLGNLQKRIRTYSQEILKNNKFQVKLPDVEDYKKPNDFYRLKLSQKSSSMTVNSNLSPTKDINFKYKYINKKSNQNSDPQISYKKKIELIDKNWQELLQENDFL